MNQRKVSARYYLFEQVLEQTPGFAALRRRRTMAWLRRLAERVWTMEGARGKCPVVQPRAALDCSNYVYTPGAGESGVISLAPKHRNSGGLLHEMAHALGHYDKYAHGPAFRRRCLRLYKDYGHWNGEVS